MPVQLKEEAGGKLLEVQASGKLEAKDYEHFVPEFERLIDQHGKIRVLFDMKDFHGWTGSGVWKDVAFDMQHFRDIERLAMVGDKKWEEWMAVFCRPFTSAEIRYFDQEDADKAHAWIESDLSRTDSPS